VCSDETVADPDAVVSNTSDLGFPVTTNAVEIAAFLRKRSGRRVVFATYGRAVASSKSLSRSEASRVIDELLQFQGGEHEDEGNRWPIQDTDDAKPRPVR